MKNIIQKSSVIIALCGTFSAVAPTAFGESLNGTNWSQNGPYHLGKLEKATKVIGTEVTDSQDEKIGKVKDLAIDTRNGRIVEVLVATKGDHLVAVPPSQFTCNATSKSLQLNVDRSQFNNAPAFRMADWQANMQQTGVSDVYRYYGVQPYFALGTGTAANGTSTPTHAAEAQVAAARAATLCYLGEVERAGKLIGTPIRNLHDEKIGKVENLMIDLPAGRVVEVIVASGGFLGMDNELSAVPPQSFHPGAESNTLVLDTTKEALSSAPHYTASRWSDMNNPEQVSTVYHAYNVEPYFSTNAADNTAQNTRDRSNDTLTPLNQGTSTADVETTRQIRKQIIATDGLSVDAHNVKIITVDGHVTLRGPVKSEDEKQQIASIANQLASPANVSNQLQVADAGTTSSVK